MSLHPIVSPLVLIAAFVLIVAGRLVALRRAERTPAAWRRWAVVTAAAVLLVGAAVRPVVGGEDGAPRVAGATEPNVFLVIDRSAQMRVPDGGDGRTRMTAARDDIAAVIDRYPSARFAVIAFASRPSLDWPLSADATSLRAVMSVVTPYPSTPESVFETNAAAAGNTLRYELIDAVQQYPRADNLVFYFGAGAGETRSPLRQFNLPDGAVDGGAVLGYGTAIDEDALRTVAGQIGVPYVHRSAGTAVTDALPAADATRDAPAIVAPPRTELYWLFALGAAVLLLIELYVVLRDFRRTR